MLHWRFLAPVIALATLVACTQPPIPEDHFYRLTLKGPETSPGRAAAAPLPAGVIQVERFVADGLTANRPIAFSEAGRPQVLQTYHYHFWIEPPTALLQAALADYLRRSGAERVVTPDLRVEPDFVVSGRIRGFEQVRGSPGFARAALELAVTDRKGGRLLLLKTYAAEPRTSGESVAEAAAQMSAAIEQIYAQFVRDLAGAR